MDVSTHREGLIEPADRGSERDIVDMYMRLDTSIKGVVRWHLRTVSALGAMIVKVPVLAASGVAGVTVTVVSE